MTIEDFLTDVTFSIQNRPDISKIKVFRFVKDKSKIDDEPGHISDIDGYMCNVNKITSGFLYWYTYILGVKAAGKIKLVDCVKIENLNTKMS